jgi:pimeloyl-ACP methyl ester carboxylesterase
VNRAGAAAFLAVLILACPTSLWAMEPATLSRASIFEAITPCPFEAAAEVPPERLLCGYLSVPENRNRAGSDLLKLPVAVIRTTSQNPQPDPVIFLAGGPGASPTSSAHSFNLFAGHALGKDRDIILFTQRGALMTEPSLRCDELRDARASIYTEDQTLAERDAEIARAATSCLRSLRDQGRDLAGYSAAENAHDLRDLRMALGIEDWNLLAVSYGTLMSLEAARIDPEGIRSMVLDSLVSLQSDLFMSEANRNFAYGLGRVLKSCEDDTDCRRQFPGLPVALDQLLANLKQQPVTVNVAAGGDSRQDIIVNWHDFLGLVHWMLYNARTVPLVPLLIDETWNGRLELLTLLAERVFPAPANAGDSAAGAFFAIVCQDQFTRRNPLPRAEAAYGGFAITSFMENVCSDPDFNYGDTPERPLFRSSIPTLLLSGYFDPMTPDIYAEQTASLLDHRSLLRIPDYGHSTLSGYTACQTEVATRFLDDLQPELDYPCLADLPKIQFVLTTEQARQQLGVQ